MRAPRALEEATPLPQQLLLQKLLRNLARAVFRAIPQLLEFELFLGWAS
jgi:hypothetical protein